LAWTGKGHGTDRAIILGLAGERPETVDPANAEMIVQGAREKRTLRLAGGCVLGFDPEKDIVFDQVTAAPQHPNTFALTAFAGSGEILYQER
jgi:L-serine dehydratase